MPRSFHPSGARDSTEPVPSRPADPGKRTLTRGLSVQRRGGPGPSDPAEVLPIAASGLSAGGPLPYRAELEASFGLDLGHVRVHGGANAVAASDAIGAEAYAVGNDIVLGRGAPTRALIAHEVTHVIQQGAGVAPTTGVGEAGDALELEADRAAAAVDAGQTFDVAAGHGAAAAGGAVQRLAVQRFSSAEHAQIVDGMQYPFALAEQKLPNGAHATTGEIVAFGDFYPDLEHLRLAPRQETEAIVGLIRFEGIWNLAQRQHNGAARGGSATQDPTPAPTGPRDRPPDGHRLDTRSATLKWTDPLWDDLTIADCPGGLRARALEIHSQFTPAWGFFGVSLPLTSRPETNMAALRFTLGRRRFRGSNDALGQPGTADPGHLGGDFVDLAANNISHFAVNNWATWEAMHARACADGKDPSRREGALLQDALGAHYLTDSFSSGHLLDKQDLMSYATELMVSMAPMSTEGPIRHASLYALLVPALYVCLCDPEVAEKWRVGCQNAHQQGLIGDQALAAMSAAVAAPSQGLTLALAHTIMNMPWRNQIDPSVAGSAGDRNQGPDAAATGHGDYHLGVGNLAALQAHDALNAIGLRVRNPTGDSWYMQGDDHLSAAAQAAAHKAVAASRQQVESGRFAPDEIRALAPSHAQLDLEGFRDHLLGGDKRLRYNHRELRALRQLVLQLSSEFPLTESRGDKQVVSEPMRQLGHQLVRTLFIAADADSDQPDATPRLNLSTIKALLVERLPEMVALSYIATGIDDLPAAALEVYAPRTADGRVLPRAAHDIHWRGDAVHFRLDVAGCSPGSTVDVGIEVCGRRGGPDLTEAGQSEESDDTRAITTFSVPQVIPTDLVTEADGRAWVDVSVPVDWHRWLTALPYVVIHGDKHCQTPIGRSPVQGEQTVSNTLPAEIPPRVTGSDADTPTHYAATGVVAGALVWEGATCRFAVTHNAPPRAPDLPVRVWYRAFGRDLDYDHDESGRTFPEVCDTDAPLGPMQSVDVHGVARPTVDVLVNAADDADTYVIVYADRVGTQVLGRSSVQGVSRGTLAPEPGDTVRGDQAVDLAWSGPVLAFRVLPEAAARVWVRFYDQDWGNDRDRQGRLIDHGLFDRLRNDDPQLGETHTVPVHGGRAVIAAAGVGDSPGNTYAVVFADPSCSMAIGRSDVQP